MELLHRCISGYIPLETRSTGCLGSSLSTLAYRHSTVQLYSCYLYLAWSRVHWMVWTDGRRFRFLLHSCIGKLCTGWNKRICPPTHWTYCLLYCALFCHCAWNHCATIPYREDCSQITLPHCSIYEITRSRRGSIRKFLILQHKRLEFTFILMIFVHADSQFSFKLWCYQQNFVTNSSSLTFSI